MRRVFYIAALAVLFAAALSRVTALSVSAAAGEVMS